MTDNELMEKAKKLAQEYIIVDTHIDVPYRLTSRMEDISVRTQKGDFDYPRAKEGGLNVAFMSIYIPSENEEKGSAKELADKLIDMVNKFTTDWPDKFAIVTSAEEVKKQFSEGKVLLPMGMENGAPIEGKIENLKYFYDRGIRYITLTHSKNNHICDSSFDKERKWNGLSPFGKEVVAEMNRLGIIIDVSHVSDSTFYQVMRLSKAPVIASHSSCRYFTPGWERNISDEMIKLLAKNNGVVHINFGSSFVNDNYRQKMSPAWGYIREHNLQGESAEEFFKKYQKENNIPFADVSEVVNHIDHVIKLVGVDYVGFGSDFDGLGDSLPTGLKDVSYYPNLIYELLKRGYSDKDIKKICGDNVLRVWEKVEKVAQELQVKK